MFQTVVRRQRYLSVRVTQNRIKVGISVDLTLQVTALILVLEKVCR